MFSFNIFKVLAMLLLVQLAYGKPLKENNFIFDADKHRNDTSPQIQLLVYTSDNLANLSQQFIANATAVCRNILKDESFRANETPEVQLFKNNLTMFVQNYESPKDLQTNSDPMQYFVKTITYYLELPEDNRTPESTFILDMLNKYEIKNMKENYVKQFDEFIEKFKQRFEETKEHFDNNMLQWYERFKTLTDFGDRFLFIIVMFFMR
ncbi:uncharacterized protein LOC135952464 [Calliphora vicina]|uniref:uncharacterized protein LOC135952464 n=1 Tax=Calliphora vicina TaxID=7373 RepID=UPI00325A74F7